MEKLLKAHERWWVAGLFGILLLQLLYGLQTDGLTDDELVYIGSGYRHIHRDFRINPEQPPAAKLVGALPLLALRPRISSVQPGEDQCGWSYRFLHQQNRARSLLPVARVPMVGLTVGLAALLWVWARRVGGVEAGVLALAVAAFQPAFLAHGHLVATDLPGALSMLAASWFFWRFCEQPNGPRAVAVAAMVTVAVLTRLTALILVPIFAVLTAVEWWRSRARARVGRGLLLLIAAHLLVAPLVLWAAYGFRYEPWPGDPSVYGAWPHGAAGQGLRWIAAHRLLPYAFVEGLRFQVEHSAIGHHGYLMGDRGTSGWWYYYLVALLVKNTPGFLALLLVAAWASRNRLAPPARVWWHWFVPVAVILAGASAGRIQIGERYVVAVYPYLILWIATACAPLLAARRTRFVLAAALTAHVVPALLVAPRGYLTYFNAIAGGPEGGHRWLADSNLDWGQDLPRLARWMREKGVARIQLGYFGSDDPDRYGIAHHDLPTWHSHHPMHIPAEPFKGTVVVSPNLLLGFLVPPGKNAYEFLLTREPDERVGIFFVYHLK